MASRVLSLGLQQENAVLAVQVRTAHLRSIVLGRALPLATLQLSTVSSGYMLIQLLLITSNSKENNKYLGAKDGSHSLCHGSRADPAGLPLQNRQYHANDGHKRFM
jgi:hypothetical protein